MGKISSLERNISSGQLYTACDVRMVSRPTASRKFTYMETIYSRHCGIVFFVLLVLERFAGDTRRSRGQHKTQDNEETLCARVFFSCEWMKPEWNGCNGWFLPMFIARLSTLICIARRPFNWLDELNDHSKDHVKWTINFWYVRYERSKKPMIFLLNAIIILLILLLSSICWAVFFFYRVFIGIRRDRRVIHWLWHGMGYGIDCIFNLRFTAML